MKKTWIFCFIMLIGALDAFAQDYYMAELFDKGRMELQMGLFEEALGYFNEIIYTNNQHEGAYFERGRTFIEQKKYYDALADFQRVIELNPYNPDPYFYRGVVYYRLGEYENAIENLDGAITLKSDYILAYNYRAESYRELGLIPQAIADYDVIISYNAEEALLYFGRGKCKMQVEDYNGAVYDFSEAINQDYENITYWLNRINANFLAQNFFETSWDIQKLQEIAPDSVEIYHIYLDAYCKAQIQDYEGAIVSITQVIDSEPEVMAHYEERASYYLALNDYENVIQDYYRLSEFEPENTEYLLRIARLYDELGEDALVFQMANEILNIHDTSAEAWYLKGSSAIQLNKPKKEYKQMLVNAAGWGYPKESMSAYEAKMAKKGFKYWKQRNE